MSDDKPAIVCPKCGNGVPKVEENTKDEPAVDIIVGSGGEIISAKTETLVEYVFHPCEHTAFGTRDIDEESLRYGDHNELE